MKILAMLGLDDMLWYACKYTVELLTRSFQAKVFMLFDQNKLNLGILKAFFGKAT